MKLKFKICWLVSWNHLRNAVYIEFWSNIHSLVVWKTVLSVQSNLCTTATLGTPKKWPLFRGWPLFKGWSKILGKLIVGLVEQGIWAGHCWQVAVVQRWPLAQVWLLFQEKKFSKFVKFVFIANLLLFIKHSLFISLGRTAITLKVYPEN